MMKERPILFSGPMVRAILDGRKTMTRRVIKTDGYGAEAVIKNDNAPLHVRIVDDLWASVPFSCPYGQPGDRLWVRETLSWRFERDTNYEGLSYAMDGKEVNGEWPAGWGFTGRRYDADEATLIGTIPSIFMPRWASRLTLEITAIRVERVQDITEEDAKAEGMGDIPYMMPGEEGIRGFGPGCIARPRFRALWNDINAKRGYGWDENPWVWVITFRPIKESSHD